MTETLCKNFHLTRKTVRIHERYEHKNFVKTYASNNIRYEWQQETLDIASRMKTVFTDWKGNRTIYRAFQPLAA